MKKSILLFIEFIFLANSFLSAQNYSFRIDISGEGTPVVLIPGFTCDGQVWDNTVDVLSANYQCHVLTLPGFSNQPAIEFEETYLPVIADEIVKYIQEKELESPILIGHSLGGMLGLDIAIDNPELLSKLVIVDAFPFLAAAQNPMATVESMKPFAENMKTSYLNQNEEMYKSQIKMALESMIGTKDSIPVALNWGMTSDRKTAAQAMYDLYTTDLRDQLNKIKSPTLVLGAWVAYKDYGVTEEMITQTFNTQYSSLENVQIKLSNKGRHFLMWDDPEFTHGEIKSFLAKP